MTSPKQQLSRRQFLQFSGALTGALLSNTVSPIPLPNTDAQTKAKSWFITGQEVPSLAAFDTTMQTFMLARDLRFGSLAVTESDRLVLARAYSYVGSPTKAIQPTTLFRIASVSKPITAQAIYKLVQAGDLTLDDKLVDLLPMTPPTGQSRDSRLQNITVQHLLDHKGGWNRDTTFDPMFHDFQIAAALGVPLPINRQHIMTYMSGRPLQADPGSTYAYSNFGYLLLGEIVAAVTGISYKKWVKNNLLAPYGLEGMQAGRSSRDRARLNEVKYRSQYKSTTVLDNSSALVKLPYGGFRLENMLAHGGWIASAPQIQ